MTLDDHIIMAALDGQNMTRWDTQPQLSDELFYLPSELTITVGFYRYNSNSTENRGFIQLSDLNVSGIKPSQQCVQCDADEFLVLLSIPFKIRWGLEVFLPVNAMVLDSILVTVASSTTHSGITAG